VIFLAAFSILQLFYLFSHVKSFSCAIPFAFSILQLLYLFSYVSILQLFYCICSAMLNLSAVPFLAAFFILQLFVQLCYIFKLCHSLQLSLSWSCFICLSILTLSAALFLAAFSILQLFYLFSCAFPSAFSILELFCISTVWSCSCSISQQF